MVRPGRFALVNSVVSPEALERELTEAMGDYKEVAAKDTAYNESVATLEIGAIVKLFGFWATVGGAFLGGVLMLRLGINRALWVFGILQGVSTAGFAVLARIGYSLPALSGVIAFENLTAGMGTAAYVAFMASITNRKFTATQYALLSSLMGVPRVVASAPTGFLAKQFGWESFFIACVLIAIPGILLLLKFAPWSSVVKT